jgi:hypothetical protein
MKAESVFPFFAAFASYPQKHKIALVSREQCFLMFEHD